MWYARLKWTVIWTIFSVLILIIIAALFWSEFDFSDPALFGPFVILILVIPIGRIFSRIFFQTYIMDSWSKLMRDDPDMFWIGYFAIAGPSVAVLTTLFVVGQLGISDMLEPPPPFYWAIYAIFVTSLIFGPLELKYYTKMMDKWK